MKSGGKRYSPKHLKTTSWGTRAAAWALAAALLIPMLNWARVYAVEPPEGRLCVHHPEHTSDCGFVEATPGSPCSAAPTAGLPEDQVYTPGQDAQPEHVHDASCGYAPAQEGHPCTYLCPLCVSSWTWNDPEAILTTDGDAKLWGLGLPGASEAEPATWELLETLLPQSVTVSTLDGKQSEQPLSWDLSGFPETGAAQGRFSVSASLPESFVLTDSASALSVLVEVGEGEMWAETADKMKFLNKWYFITPEGEEISNGELTVNILDMESKSPEKIKAELENLLLPQRIGGWVPNDSLSDLRLPYLGFIQNTKKTDSFFITTEADDTEYTSGAQWGSFPIDGWRNFPSSYQEGVAFTVQAYTVTKYNPEDNASPPLTYRLFVNSNNSADYISIPGTEKQSDTRTNPGILNLKVTLHNVNSSDYTVPAASPANVKVNLFDYCVDPARDGSNNVDDLLTKSDWHYGKSTDYARTGVQDWNKGINQGRLLLFGDGLIHAGLWNKGAGAITDYGKRHAGMTGIVNPVLKDGYPVINVQNYNHKLADYTDITDWKLAGDELTTGDPARTENDIISYDRMPEDNPQNISNTLYKLWNTPGNDASLDYLFDLSSNEPAKRAFENVTGLFQIDDEGYYYYNMRENFAAYDQSKNQFILYDSPAVDRTDQSYQNGSFTGGRSIGNFFPFNTASQVFDIIKDDKLASSENIQSHNERIKTGDYMNHHLGMTVDVEFMQPNNGMVNTGSGQQPMTFAFSGDDDVWVFVDDVLVLDLGGIHSEIYGVIDFSTGNVAVGQSWKTNGFPKTDKGKVDIEALLKGTSTTVTENIRTDSFTLKQLFEAAGKTDVSWVEVENPDGTTSYTFASNTSHTLKMFYLERGNYDSSLALRFNLQPLLHQQIVKVDQNGEPLEGVTFELYPATEAAESDDGAIQCRYTDSDINNQKTFYVKQSGDLLLTLKPTDDKGSATFLQTDESYFNFADQKGQYYILHEKDAPAGYRKQPIDIVLHYDTKTSVLSVANRWTTGAYACSMSHVVSGGTLNYGAFVGSDQTQDGTDAGTGSSVNTTDLEGGLVVAVPIKSTSGETRYALHGSNLGGFDSVPLKDDKGETAWQKAVLSAALEQAKKALPENDQATAEAAGWYLEWNENNRQLTGTLYDLPGLATSYKLNNEDGDMHMVYGIISQAALDQLGITGDTAKDRYQALGQYLETHTTEGVCNDLLSGFRALRTKQFNRNFRSMIYIPNERRELWVQKIDQDGNPLAGAEFTLYRDEACTNPVVSGTTGENGYLIFSAEKSSDINEKSGWAKMEWANSADKTQYYLRETTPPPSNQYSYELNPTVIPIVVGTYSIYADAGNANDGVTVLAGVGRLTQTMRQYARENLIDVTLQDITATKQTQHSGSFSADGWKDKEIENSTALDKMNLHFQNDYAVVDYGLHKADNGAVYKPFFVTDTGFVRARVEQMPESELGRYTGEGQNTVANRDELGETDLTNLFSLLNVVVVTDQNTSPNKPKTGQLTIKKQIDGIGLLPEDYKEFFKFKVELTGKDGNPVTEYKYYFYGDSWTGDIQYGDETSILMLRHNEAVTILGLPEGTKFKITEFDHDGWQVNPSEHNGVIDENKEYIATFTNTKDPAPDTGSLEISKKVTGTVAADDQEKDFTFTVGLFGQNGSALSDSFPYSGSHSKEGTISSGGTITLAKDEKITIRNLPVGTTYTVTETVPDGWKTDSSEHSGTIAKDETAAVQFTNQKDGDQPDPPTDPGTGSLKISKTVKGDSLSDTDKAQQFTFTVTFTATDGTSLTGSFPYTGSKSGTISDSDTITLAGGESITITGLPVETKYTVTETVPDGWKADSSEHSGTIVKDAAQAAGFTNSKPGTPPTDPPGGGGGGNTPKDPDPPKEPETPTEPEQPEQPETPETPENPEQPPEEPETPEQPETPEIPEHRTELPDPNDPDSPDEVTVWDGDVPTTYKKVWDPEEEEWVYVPEEDVPTTWKEDVPATGDRSLVWIGAALLSGGVLAAVLLLKKKDKKH